MDLEVIPNAERDLFPSGYNPWRKRIQARVRAPAQDGRANQALLDLVARVLEVPRANVELLAGATDRHKTLRIRGATPAHLEPILGGLVHRR